MRKLQKPLTLLLMVTLLAGVAIALRAGSEEIELTLIARDMAFYLEGDPRPNPTLELGRGQRVRIHFINEDRGVVHDLWLPDLGISTAPLPGDGSAETLSFRTPEKELDSSYACTRHMAMMTAALEIR
jgi:hypothetical protein